MLFRSTLAFFFGKSLKNLLKVNFLSFFFSRQRKIKKMWQSSELCDLQVPAASSWCEKVQGLLFTETEQFDDHDIKNREISWATCFYFLYVCLVLLYTLNLFSPAFLTKHAHETSRGRGNGTTRHHQELAARAGRVRTCHKYLHMVQRSSLHAVASLCSLRGFNMESMSNL